jgi:hypothetical protein
LLSLKIQHLFGFQCIMRKCQIINLGGRMMY